MLNTPKDWWDALREDGAVWQHSGNPRAPHVVLRSGKHSDLFIDTLAFLSNVENLGVAAQALAQRLRRVLGTAQKIDWVFGSPMAGIPLATAIAPFLQAELVGFTEKGSGGDKDLICRFDVREGDTVLLVEEMTTTGGTPQRGIDAIRKRSPEAKIIPFVGAFLTRCPRNPPELRDATLVDVVNLPELGILSREWEPAGCLLCNARSRAIERCKRVWKDLLITMVYPDHSIPL